MPILSIDEWKEYLSKCPDAHLLQTAAWGELKSKFGWQAVRIAVDNGGENWGCQILFRKLPFGLSLAYLPKGPVLNGGFRRKEDQFPGQAFWAEVDRICRQKRAIFLKVEPDQILAETKNGMNDLPSGFEVSQHAIQPMRTIVVELDGDEDDILARMKQKTRYNIRLASKKGVRVNSSKDVETFYELMETTGERDQFAIHSLKYYRTAYDLFKPEGKCELLLAYFEEEPIAAVMVFAAAHRAWYLYGASISRHRDRMPTYLLQWEAMRWARKAGCDQYDLWGVPDYDQQILEDEFTSRSDGLWGVYRFKRGFGGKVTRSAGPWDRIYQPFIYRLYLRWVARSSQEY